MTDARPPVDPSSSGSKPAVDLAGEPFFRDVPPDEIAILAPLASIARYSQSTTVFRAGEPADRFFLIRQGRVALFLPSVRQDVIVQTIGAGEALGFSWLAPPHLWRFSANTQSDAEFMEFDARALRRAAIANRDLHDLLMTRMFSVVTRRLEAARMQLLDIYSDSRTP